MSFDGALISGCAVQFWEGAFGKFVLSNMVRAFLLKLFVGFGESGFADRLDLSLKVLTAAGLIVQSTRDQILGLGTSGCIAVMNSFSNAASIVTVVGRRLGTAGSSVSGRVGFSGCEGSIWTSETSVACLAASGVSGTVQMGITFSVRASSMSQAMSYDGAGVSGLSASNRGSTGRTQLTLMGSGLGRYAHSVEGRLGETGCEGSVWASETSVRCHIARAFLRQDKVGVTVGTLIGSLTKGMSIDGVASMLAFAPSNVVSSEGNLITVVGSGFGQEGYSAIGRLGNSACEGSAWASETSVVCLAANGVHRTLGLIFSVAIRVSSVSEGVSYDGAGISAVSVSNRGGTRCSPMMLMGSGLGAREYTGAGRVGGTSCEVSNWTSETSIRCHRAGGILGLVGVGLTVEVCVGSLTEVMSYDGASISALTQSNAFGGLGVSTTVTVLGSGFGLAAAGYSVKGDLGNSGCESSLWMSETSVAGLAASGVSGTKHVGITLGISAQSRSEALSYDGTGTLGVCATNRGGSWSAPVTTMGLEMRGWVYSGAGRVGGTGCQGSRWASESSVMCHGAGGLPGSTKVGLTVG
eukprot:220424-Rhodomonas_salina.1